MLGKVRTGIAGWVFPEWRDNFYPKGLPQKQELNFASRALGAIEINATFYSHQAPKSFAAWAAQTPDDFVFPVKGHQLITHIKKLKEVETALANFFASGVMALGSRLGPFVWQLPGNLKYDPERLEAFLSVLPQTPDALVALARQHDDRLKHEPYLDATGVAAVRHAIEVRHASFATPEFIEQLRRHGVALVTADTAEWPYLDQTAGFSYLRLQGAPGADHYEDGDVAQWADRVGQLASGAPITDGPLVAPAMAPTDSREVFAHFVSTDKVHAPRNAMALAARLS